MSCFQGVPLHPMYRSILPLLDSFTAELSDKTAAIIITPNHVVPSTRFTKCGYPAHLAPLLSSLLIPKPHPSIEASNDTIKPSRSETQPNKKNDGGKSFLGMSNVDLDVRKWKWPGYLTFGKSPGKRPNVSFDEGVAEPEIKTETKMGDADYDKRALEDAISSDATSLSESAADTNPSEASKTPTVVSLQDATSPETFPFPEFLSTTIHLVDSQDALQTRRQRVFYVLVRSLSKSVRNLTRSRITPFCSLLSVRMRKSHKANLLHKEQSNSSQNSSTF